MTGGRPLGCRRGAQPGSGVPVQSPPFCFDLEWFSNPFLGPAHLFSSQQHLFVVEGAPEGTCFPSCPWDRPGPALPMPASCASNPENTLSRTLLLCSHMRNILVLSPSEAAGACSPARLPLLVLSVPCTHRWPVALDKVARPGLWHVLLVPCSPGAPCADQVFWG